MDRTTRNPWLLLGIAIVVEVAATLSMRGAVDHPVLLVVVAAGYVTAFVLMSKVLALGIPVGVAYGIWGATGVALTAILAAFIFSDAFTPLMGVGIVLIGAGVLLIEFGHQAATAHAPTTDADPDADRVAA